jgi:hypothetical protein
MEVFKVVRVDSRNRLVSAILPDHLSVIYRNLLGRIRTVPTSMAFSNLADARWFRECWSRRGRSLQIWRATADMDPDQPTVVIDQIGSMPIRIGGTTIPNISSDHISRREWATAVKTLHTVTKSHFSVGMICLMLTAAPLGTLWCTNLRLVEMISHE